MDTSLSWAEGWEEQTDKRENESRMLENLKVPDGLGKLSAVWNENVKVMRKGLAFSER